MYHIQYTYLKVLNVNNFKRFHKKDDHHALMDEHVKGANVAYSLDFLKKVFEDTGFKLKHISSGKWKNKDSQKDFQDFVVLEKI